MFIKDNKTSLLLNDGVKKILPAYRCLRSTKNNLLDVLYIAKMNKDVGLDKYELIIKNKNIEELNGNLPDLFSDEIFSGKAWLINKDRVKAKLIYKGKEYKVEVRYRGDNPNHWTRDKKSWQIVFDKDDLLHGLKTIKLIIPSDRRYFVEYLNNYRAKKLGLFYPESKYVQLFINKKYYGVYYQFEDWDNAFLEKNQLPTESSLYVTNDSKLESNVIDSAFDTVEGWKKQVNNDVYDFDDYSEIKFLLEELQGDNFVNVAPDILDLENLYNWNVLSLLAGSNHQGDNGNMRLYFNKSMGKFQFIPWDVNLDVFDKGLDEGGLDTLLKKILNNSEYELERNKLLWDYVGEKKNIQDDLEFYDQIYNKTKTAFYSDFAMHDNNFEFDNIVKQKRSIIEDNFNRIKKLFKDDSSRYIVQYDKFEDRITLSVIVDNFAGLKIDKIDFPKDNIISAGLYYDTNQNKKFDSSDELINISKTIDQEKLLFDSIENHLFTKRNKSEDKIPSEYNFFIKLNSKNDQSAIDLKKININFLNYVTGDTVKVKNKKYIDNSSFYFFHEINKTKEQFVRENSIFKIDNNNIRLRRGNYFIKENIIVPKGYKLIIDSGVRLNLFPDVSLISYSPIIAVGKKYDNIIFRQAVPGKKWGVIGVLNCEEEKSEFNFVDMGGGESAYINGVFFSGMLSAYHSDINIENSIIKDANDDDGLNVKYSKVEISNNIFKKNSSDAIDLDFCEGKIINNNFIENGNDSIDISGTEVRIENNNFFKSGDKCISIGEKSENVIIYNNVLNNCLIGIEVKDLSLVYIINNVIVNNDIGINAYEKKEIFGGGKALVYNSIIRNNEKNNIKTDNKSDILIYSSNMVGSNDNNNFQDEPIFLDANEDNYIIDFDKANLKFRDGGNSEILFDLLNIDQEYVPIGLNKK